MKKRRNIILVTVLIPLAVAGALGALLSFKLSRTSEEKKAAQKTFVEDFRLLDHEGRAHDLYRMADATSIVLISQQNGDSGLGAIADRLRELNSAWSTRGVRFLMINASGKDSRQEVAAEIEKHRLPLPVLMDTAQIISSSLGFSVTPEILVIKPALGWNIIYRGGIKGIVPALENPKPQPVFNVAEGTPIPYLRQEKISYSRTIAPILKRRCIVCHQEGLYPPQNWRSYDDIREWGAMIRETVRKGLMPPMLADPEFGDFMDNSFLSADETRQLVTWIETGMPRGKGKDPLRFKRAAESRSPVPPDREADFTLEMKEEIVIPPEGFLLYQYVKLGDVFTKDTWIKSLKLSSRVYPQIHHISLIRVPPKLLKELNEKHGSQGAEQAYMTGKVRKFNIWSPGKTWVRYPQNSALKVEKGSQLVLELHYVGSGKQATDRIKVDFYHPPRSEKVHALGNLLMTRKKFVVPANERDYVVTTPKQVLDRSITITGFFPHMHMRGKGIKSLATYPDGKIEVLISAPTYDFNWQKGIRLRNPKKLPKGTELITYCEYDNSGQNPNNPDPAVPVRWGQRSVENEMCVMNVMYYED